MVLFTMLLCLGSCGGCETKRNTSEQDSDSITSYELDTLLAERLDHAVHHKQRMTDEQLSISVFDLTLGEPLYAFRDQEHIPPASCLKLLTAVAALKYMGMDYEFHNRLSIKGDIWQDILYGSVTSADRRRPAV